MLTLGDKYQHHDGRVFELFAADLISKSVRLECDPDCNEHVVWNGTFNEFYAVFKRMNHER